MRFCRDGVNVVDADRLCVVVCDSAEVGRGRLQVLHVAKRLLREGTDIAWGIGVSAAAESRGVFEVPSAGMLDHEFNVSDPAKSEGDDTVA